MITRYLRYDDRYYRFPRIRWGTLPFSTVEIKVIVFSWRGKALARHRFEGEAIFYPEEHNLDQPHRRQLTQYAARPIYTTIPQGPPSP